MNGRGGSTSRPGSDPAGGPAPGVVRLPDGCDAVLLDLDGVVYRGAQAVGGSPVAIADLRAAGIPVAFATNNAARTPESVAAALQRLGIDAAPRDVVTSAQVVAAVLLERLGHGARVLVVGGKGLHAAVAEVGLREVADATHHPDAVVQGFGPDVGWRDLAEASYAVQQGAWWVASNDDLTVPTDRGTAPGNGSLVAAVAAATGRRPLVTGKPAPDLLQAAARRVDSVRPLFVGDRLDTDIAGAVAAGFRSCLVLTGVSRAQDIDVHGPQPTWVADTLLDVVRGAVYPARPRDPAQA